MCVAILGAHLGPGPELELAQPKKTTNWMFQSKVVTLKSPLVCHYWAAQPQNYTPSPLKFPKYLDSSETASQKQMRSWSGAWIQALSPPSMWDQKGFGTEQLFWHCGRVCSCPNYLQIPHVSPGGTMLSELPTLPQERGSNCPPSTASAVQILVVWEGVWRQQFQPKGLSGLQDAAEDVPGALWHQQTREIWRMAYFSFRMPGLGRSLQKSCHDPCSRFSTAARSATYSLLQSTAAHLQEVTPCSRENIQESGRSFSPLKTPTLPANTPM